MRRVLPVVHLIAALQVDVGADDEANVGLAFGSPLTQRPVSAILQNMDINDPHRACNSRRIARATGRPLPN